MSGGLQKNRLYKQQQFFIKSPPAHVYFPIH